MSKPVARSSCLMAWLMLPCLRTCEEQIYSRLLVNLLTTVSETRDCLSACYLTCMIEDFVSAIAGVQCHCWAINKLCLYLPVESGLKGGFGVSACNPFNTIH